MTFLDLMKSNQVTYMDAVSIMYMLAFQICCTNLDQLLLRKIVCSCIHSQLAIAMYYCIVKIFQGLCCISLKKQFWDKTFVNSLPGCPLHICLATQLHSKLDNFQGFLRNPLKCQSSKIWQASDFYFNIIIMIVLISVQRTSRLMLLSSCRDKFTAFLHDSKLLQEGAMITGN